MDAVSRDRTTGVETMTVEVMVEGREGCTATEAMAVGS